MHETDKSDYQLTRRQGKLLDQFLALAVLAYLYPPGACADDRKTVRYYAARVIRRYRSNQ